MGSTRPAGGRPPGRRGRAGVGPGPGYRPSGTGKGTKHSWSGIATAPQRALAYAMFLVMPALVVIGIVLFFLNGYGLLG